MMGSVILLRQRNPDQVPVSNRARGQHHLLNHPIFIAADRSVARSNNSTILYGVRSTELYLLPKALASSTPFPKGFLEIFPLPRPTSQEMRI